MEILERNELTNGTGTTNPADDIINARRILDTQSAETLLSGELDWQP